MNKAFIAFGANKGNPKREIRLALSDLEAVANAQILKISSFYETSPVDSSGPNYINGVALIETNLDSQELLKALQEIESTHGRKRTVGVRNEPRTMDLDILTFNDEVINEPNLIVPHPRMEQRLFVMVPLSEIAPDWVDPLSRPISEIIEIIRKEDPTQKIQKAEAIF